MMDSYSPGKLSDPTTLLLGGAGYMPPKRAEILLLGGNKKLSLERAAKLTPRDAGARDP